MPKTVHKLTLKANGFSEHLCGHMKYAFPEDCCSKMWKKVNCKRCLKLKK